MTAVVLGTGLSLIQAVKCARQETKVLVVCVLFAVVVNLALRSNAQGRIEVVGMRKLTILVGLGAFPVTIMGDPEIEDEVPRPSRVLEVADNLDVTALLSQGHWA